MGAVTHGWCLGTAALNRMGILITVQPGDRPHTASGPPKPRWYRTSRLWGAVLTAAGAIGFIALFPFIGSDPETKDPGDYVDPNWFSVVAPILIAVLIAGACLLMAPALHRWLRRSR